MNSRESPEFITVEGQGVCAFVPRHLRSDMDVAGRAQHQDRGRALRNFDMYGIDSGDVASMQAAKGL